MNIKNSARFSVAIALVPALAGCNLTPEELAALGGAFEGEHSSYTEALPPPEPSCFVDRYVQPEAEITNKLDLVFVTDTSGSLQTERGAIADGIDAFIAALPPGVDYRVGVIFGHGSRSSWAGKLYQRSGYGPVLNSQTMSVSKIRADLRYLLTNTVNDTYADGGEEMLYSLSRAMDDDRLAYNRGLGMFREDAALAIVFVTDENDICATFPAGVTPVPDPDRLEVPAKTRDCAGINPASMINKVKGRQGDRPLVFGSIAYNRLETVPREGENELGYGILELITLANGVSIDLAGGHYSEGLSQIGSLARQKLNLLFDFTLARPNIDVDTIAVNVDGQSAEFTYAAETSEVHVPSPGISRSIVDISYCQIPETPNCSGPGCGGGGVIGI